MWLGPCRGVRLCACWPAGSEAAAREHLRLEAHTDPKQHHHHHHQQQQQQQQHRQPLPKYGVGRAGGDAEWEGTEVSPGAEGAQDGLRTRSSASQTLEPCGSGTSGPQGEGLGRAGGGAELSSRASSSLGEPLLSDGPPLLQAKSGAFPFPLPATHAGMVQVSVHHHAHVWVYVWLGASACVCVRLYPGIGHAVLARALCLPA